MQLRTRKLLDKSFSGVGFFSILLMGVAVLVLIIPIVVNGLGAFYFKGTIEFRKFLYFEFSRGNYEQLKLETTDSDRLRIPAYQMIRDFQEELENGLYDNHSSYEDFEMYIDEIHDYLISFLGPEPVPVICVHEYKQFVAGLTNSGSQEFADKIQELRVLLETFSEEQYISTVE
ncbi:MAG: hypothetical protein K8S56_06600, partial [Candidatus Cloacimonetes bacterium]|nr:hypothetical protein [Candidatus Cloacimonadota bacterium]